MVPSALVITAGSRGVAWPTPACVCLWSAEPLPCCPHPVDDWGHSYARSPSVMSASSPAVAGGGEPGAGHGPCTAPRRPARSPPVRDGRAPRPSGRRRSASPARRGGASCCRCARAAPMVAGADSIDDMDLLRRGGMDRLFGGVRAPRDQPRDLQVRIHPPLAGSVSLAATSSAGRNPAPTRPPAPARRTTPDSDRRWPRPCVPQAVRVTGRRSALERATRGMSGRGRRRPVGQRKLSGYGPFPVRPLRGRHLERSATCLGMRYDKVLEDQLDAVTVALDRRLVQLEAKATRPLLGSQRASD